MSREGHFRKRDMALETGNRNRGLQNRSNLWLAQYRNAQNKTKQKNCL